MKKILIGILIGLLLYGIGIGIYCNLKKSNNNQEINNNNQEEVSEEISIDSQLVTNLMNIYSVFDSFYASGIYWGYFYQKDKYIVDENENGKIYIGKYKETDKQTFETYKDQLDSYKYTFNYDNGNYYLYSVELVK